MLAHVGRTSKNSSVGPGMESDKYRITAEHNNPLAYRQFYGGESRVDGFAPLRARDRLWRAFAYAQALFQRKSASRF